MTVENWIQVGLIIVQWVVFIVVVSWALWQLQKGRKELAELKKENDSELKRLMPQRRLIQ